MNLTGVVLVLMVTPWTILGQANYAAPYTFTTIAGPGGNFSPQGVAVDRAGNIYVADAQGGAIWKMISMGSYWVPTVLAGLPGNRGTNDGTGSAAQFATPTGVAVDSAGNVYVADYGADTIRKVTPTGVVTTLAGLASYGGFGYADGTGSAARFRQPHGVAVDSAGNVYVADTQNEAIRKVTPAGVVTTLAGLGNPGLGGPNYGSADGIGSAARFFGPTAVAVDSAGNLYVADGENSTIRKVTPVGTNWVVTTLAGPDPAIGHNLGFGSADGTGTAAGFKWPEGLAVDSAGNVYVADTGNCTIRKVAPNGEVTTLAGLAGEVGYVITAGLPGIDGTGSAAQFNSPYGVAVDTDGNIYVADTGNRLIRRGVAPMVQVVALEVTQVIQDWNNSIPLIAGKDTYVRAHLQLLPNNSQPVKVSEAMLYGTGPIGPLPGSPICAINMPDNSVTVQTTDAADPDVRGHFNNTLNFRLPDSWLSGTISLQLAWPGGLQPINVVPDNCTVPVTFVPAAVPKIEIFDVQWHDSSGTIYKNDPDVRSDLANRVLSCYPVASVDALFSTLQWAYPNPTPAKINGLPGVNDELYSMHYFSSISYLNRAGNWIFHGAIPTAGGSVYGEVVGKAVEPLPSFVSSADVGDQYGIERQTSSHEIGHNLGLQHDVSAKIFGTTSDDGETYALGPCYRAEGRDSCLNIEGPPMYVYPLFQPFDGYPDGLPTLGPMTEGDNYMIYGLDTLTLATTYLEPVLSPTNYQDGTAYFDLMSYCDSGDEDVWPSSVTYSTLLSSINSIFGPVPAPNDELRAKARSWPKYGPQSQGGGSTNYLVARGIMNFNAGTVQFLPCLPLTTTNVPGAPPLGTNFLLRALDESGAVLQEVEFALQPSQVEQNDTNLTADFIVPLAADPSIHTLELAYNGALLATLTASPHAPTLTLTAPNGGQNYATGAVNVTWSGSDADGDTLAYTVEYSADGGRTWETFAVDWPAESLGIDSSELAATTQGLMRVIASDGFNTAIAQSAAAFTVQPHAPSVRITSPRDGLVFIRNVQLFLDAAVTDMQDGALGGTNVQWNSNRDGALGDGGQVTFNAINLSEGYHTITVTATDGAGLTNSAVTHIWALHYPRPLLSVQALPGPTNVTLSWPAYYTNYLLQSSTSLSSGWAAITNNPAVNTYTGQQTVNVALSKLDAFFRLTAKP